MSLNTSLLWRLRHLGHVTASVLGIARDQRPRTVEIAYEVTLKNVSSFSQACTLILPEPQSRGMQEIIGPIDFTPSPSSRRSEARFGNLYDSWDLILAPQEEKGVQQHLIVEMKPTDLRPKKDSLKTVQDYREEQRRELQPFLEPHPHTRIQKEVIQELLKELKPTALPLFRLLNELQNIVCRKLTYGEPIDGLYRAEDALTRPMVDCGGFATLTIGLCQACGIPARLMSGFWTVASTHSMHVWVEAFHPDGYWIPLDPAVTWLRQAKRTNRSGSIGYVGSDRVIYSDGCNMTIQVGEKMVDIDFLQTPLLFQESEEIKMNYTFTVLPA